jgi:simple sugar transport system permease protein
MKRLLKLFLDTPELTGVVFLVALTIWFQIGTGGLFLNAQNTQGVLGLLPETGLVAIGVTLLMICGEFDLSVGSVFALAPMVMAVLLEQGLPFAPAFAAGLLAAAAIGLLNGVLTIRFAIPSFITTLGMMFVARSLTVVISGGFPPLLPPGVLPKWLFVNYLYEGSMFRMSFLWFVVIAVLVSLLLSRTNFGNWVRATGGFLPAAQAMGIPTQRVKIVCFIICSVLAGFAGTIQVMRLGAPLPSIGEGLELQAVAAAVIGGTSLLGGVGTILGGILGAVLIRIIDNGLVLSRVDANWFKLAIGMLTILAVILNAWLSKRAKSIKVEA